MEGIRKTVPHKQVPKKIRRKRRKWVIKRRETKTKKKTMRRRKKKKRKTLTLRQHGASGSLPILPPPGLASRARGGWAFTSGNMEAHHLVNC